jgi:hypothetical protein
MTEHKPGRDAFLADLTASEGKDAIEVLSRALLPAPRCPPGAAGRARLLDQALHGGRLWRFDRAVAELLDMSVATARAVLDRLDEPSVWVDLLPGVSLCWVDGGARVRDAMRGFMRIAAGVRTAEHEHVGTETLLVLQGACREVVTGRIVRPGEYLRSEPGSTHTIEAVAGGPDLLQLSVAEGGMRVGGRLFTPRT